MRSLQAIEWYNKALEDIYIVEDLLKTGWSQAGVCYHAQQAGEKLLKCVLVSYGDDPESGSFRTHSLVALLDRLSRFVDMEVDETSYDAARLLSGFEAASRHPGSMIGTESAKAALRAYDALATFLQPCFAQPLVRFPEEDVERAFSQESMRSFVGISDSFEITFPEGDDGSPGRLGRKALSA